MSSIIIKTEHRRVIAQHGEALYPQECRGLLLGRKNGTTKYVEDLVLIEHEIQSAPQETRYHIPSEEMEQGQEQARARDLEVIGAFHSHVDAPARPSIHDRDSAQTSFTYLIVGVRQGRAHELAAWKLSEDGTSFFQEDIRGQ